MCCKPRGGCDRVAREGADPLQKAFVTDLGAVEMRHDVRPASDRREREAAADHLAGCA